MPHSVIVLSDTPFGVRSCIIDIYHKTYLYSQNFSFSTRDYQIAAHGIRLQFPNDAIAKAFMECKHIVKYSQYLKYDE